MAVLLSLVRVFLPVILRGVEDGTLIEIVATGTKLIGLLVPLVRDPATQAEMQAVAADLGSALRPATPDDPAMARVAPAHKLGGR